MLFILSRFLLLTCGSVAERSTLLPVVQANGRLIMSSGGVVITGHVGQAVSVSEDYRIVLSALPSGVVALN